MSKFHYSAPLLASFSINMMISPFCYRLFSSISNMWQVSLLDNFSLNLLKVISFIKMEILFLFPARLSWVLAAVITTDKGIPCPSVNTIPYRYTNYK